MSDSSLVKTILDAATLTGIVAGIGWATKKVVKENLSQVRRRNRASFFLSAGAH